MNDGPPPDWDNVPPPDAGYSSGPARNGNQGGGKPRAPRISQDEANALLHDFYSWLEAPDTQQQIKMLLPGTIKPDVFIACLKTACLNKPELLRENMRASLMVATMKAAAQGLLPDGKQGALVPRWDTDANGYIVAWQPMIAGIQKLGFETGAIKHIRANIVFKGEVFRVIQGEEDRIEHEIDLDIVDEAYAALNGGKDQKGNPIARPQAFLDRVRAAYCYITGTDGTVTKRWMTRQRIISLYESSRSAKGPWNGRFLDEMILKGVIHYTAKRINLDPNSAAAKRFQAALMQDLEIDFDAQGHPEPRPAERPQQAALPAPNPMDKLGTIEAMMGAREREPVAARPETPPSPPKSATAPTPTPAPTPSWDEPPTEDSEWIVKVMLALNIDQGRGYRWLKRLEAACETAPSMDDLATLKTHTTVRTALKSAPESVQGQIDGFFRKAAERLAAAMFSGEPVTAE